MKRTTRASLAPGSRSVGMSRAVAASSSRHSASSKNNRSPSSAVLDTICQSRLLVMDFPPSPGLVTESGLGSSLRDELRDVLGATPGVRHDGQGRIDPRTRGEAAPVEDIEIVDVVRSAPLVEDTRRRIVSHPRGPVLVAGVADGLFEVDGKNLARARGLQNL